jgi:hypothetical protein
MMVINRLAVRGQGGEEKETLFASIRQSSHVTKFDYRHHASSNFDFKYSNGYRTTTDGYHMTTDRFTQILSIFMYLLWS